MHVRTRKMVVWLKIIHIWHRTRTVCTSCLLVTRLHLGVCLVLQYSQADTGALSWRYDSHRIRNNRFVHKNLCLYKTTLVGNNIHIISPWSVLLGDIFLGLSSRDNVWSTAANGADVGGYLKYKVWESWHQCFVNVDGLSQAEARNSAPPCNLFHS